MVSSIAERVTANVRAEVARKRVSQSDLAEALGLSQQAASRRLLGKVEFSFTELEAVAKLLEIPFEAFLHEQKLGASA
jgi:transcriptional regulator with XRE-family HTH domain